MTLVLGEHKDAALRCELHVRTGRLEGCPAQPVRSGVLAANVATVAWRRAIRHFYDRGPQLGL
jgi:hypothetical protein